MRAMATATATAGRVFTPPSTLAAVAAGAAPPAPPGFHPVAPLSKIPLGLSAAPSFPGVSLVIARTTAGALHALQNTCCHKQAELHLGEIEELASAPCIGAAAPGVSIRCPRHRKKFPGGLLFDAATGAAWCPGEPQEGAWTQGWGKAGDVAAFATAVHADWLFVSAEPVAGTIASPAAEDDAL